MLRGWTGGEEDTLRSRRLSPQTEPVWTDKFAGTGGPSEHPNAHCLPLHILEAHLLTRGVKSLRALGSNIKCFSTTALRKSNV